MELELINHIAIKLFKIEIFEQNPQTEKIYEWHKKYLKEKLEYWKKLYKERNKNEYLENIKSIECDLDINVSPKMYDILKNDIEMFKRQYLEEIPEKYWNYESFTEIYCLLTNGGIKCLQDALRYIDTY